MFSELGSAALFIVTTVPEPDENTAPVSFLFATVASASTVAPVIVKPPVATILAPAFPYTKTLFLVLVPSIFLTVTCAVAPDGNAVALPIANTAKFPTPPLTLTSPLEVTAPFSLI